MDKINLAIVGILILIMWLITIGILCVVGLIALSQVQPDIVRERMTYKITYEYLVYPVEINEITQIHLNQTVRVVNETKIINPQKIDKEIVKYVNQILNKKVE